MTDAPEAGKPGGMVCRMCGQASRNATRFCPKCGTDQTLETDPHAATEPADYSILAALQSRKAAGDAAKPPVHPAADVFGAAGGASARAPFSRAIGLFVLVVVIVVLGAWWLRSSRGSADSVDAAASAPASALPALSPASAVAVEPPPAASTVEPAPAASAPEVPASSAAPITLAPVEPASATAAVPASSLPPREQDNKAARDAKAKALRERREQAASQAAAARTAEQEAAARRRAEDARARTAAEAAAAAPPPLVAAPAAQPQVRNAQDICAGGNALLRAVCEARECSRREHAEEPMCLRLRAAEERRRQQE